jgi:hypothetical protein
MSACLPERCTIEFPISPPSVLRDWSRTFTARWQELRRRRSPKRLLDCEIRILDDIGLSVEEIRWALTLPLRENAITSLQSRAAARQTARIASPTQTCGWLVAVVKCCRFDVHTSPCSVGDACTVCPS